MIVDCHTQFHCHQPTFSPNDSVVGFAADDVDEEGYLRAVDPVDRAIVLGFRSRALNLGIPNDAVADYVRRHAPKLIGFAGLDPTEDACLEELERARSELNLKGVTVSPPLQDYHPTDTRAMRFFEECARLKMPVLFEQNHHSPSARLAFARPVLLDEIAREFPSLRIVIAHMGYPWIDETVVMLGKHPNVYAEVSGLLCHPWQCYNALLAAFEYGVIDKLLFGSDFPSLSPAEGIEALYSINQLSIGSNLIAIPREKLRGIVERNALALLGIQHDAEATTRRTTNLIVDHE